MPVDALIPTFINAPDDVSEPAYDAEELRRAFGGLVAGGASASVARSGLLDPRGLVPSMSGSNVQVSAGPCVVGTAKGAYLSGAPGVLTVDALTAADGTNPRRDRLVFEVLDPDNGGSTARKARFRVIPGAPSATALSGGGYPADPGAVDGVSAFFELAYIDVPKSGAGSPSLTVTSPISAAAGAPIPVRNQAQADALPKWDGAVRRRLDVTGRPLEVCDGTNWWRTGGPHAMTIDTAVIQPVPAFTIRGAYPKTFPPGKFTVPPFVKVSSSESRLNPTAANVTKDGFDLYVHNVTDTSSAVGTVGWEATQMTPTSAAG